MKISLTLDKLTVDRTKRGLRYRWYANGSDQPLIDRTLDDVDSINFMEIPASLSFELKDGWQAVAVLEALVEKVKEGDAPKPAVHTR